MHRVRRKEAKRKKTFSNRGENLPFLRGGKKKICRLAPGPTRRAPRRKEKEKVSKKGREGEGKKRIRST